MTQVSGRRAHEFCDLVLHLKFTAIDLQQVLARTVKYLSERFHRASLPGPGRSEKQEDTDRAAFRRQAGLMHMDIRHNRLNGLSLAHEDLAQPRGQFVWFIWQPGSPGSCSVRSHLLRRTPDRSVAAQSEHEGIREPSRA